MNLEEPLIFEPIYMERIWGGRRLESLFGRHLPAGESIGESWEVVDRPKAQSVVHNPPYRGKTLHDLWKNHRAELFGDRTPATNRFPLLIKILDCQEILSLQVHPPAFIAKALGGEPKTEMWYVVKAEPDAEIYAGLKAGTKPDDFVRALEQGTAADLLHRVQVRDDAFMFIPSGRLHAIGRGSVIFEIQQNSDTTFRVFDWNRTGLDEKPRELHIEESLRSIQWDDFEPGLGEADGDSLVKNDLFHVSRLELKEAQPVLDAGEDFAVFGVLKGGVRCGKAEFQPGSFFLLPKPIREMPLEPLNDMAQVLKATLPVKG